MDHLLVMVALELHPQLQDHRLREVVEEEEAFTVMLEPLVLGVLAVVVTLVLPRLMEMMGKREMLIRVAVEVAQLLTI